MDSTTDNSFRTLWGILKTAGTPDYIVDGAIVDEKDAEALPDTCFADRVRRRFPITDKANTWVSAGYFAKTASDEYSKTMHDIVLSRIKRAADVYGIGKDVDDMMSKIAEAENPQQVKSAADDESNYCDPEHRGFPVFDKVGCELANDFFSKNAYKYGHERRMSIAKNIMKKCAEYGVKAAEQVRMSAGEGFPNRETLAEHLLFRANELMGRGTYKMAEELCKFASEICMCSDEDLDRNRHGLFDAISGMDEITGIDDCYDRKFAAPEELIFDITPESMKSVIDDAVPIGGDTFSAKALSDLPRALFEKVLPKDMVDGMMEGGKISPKKLSVTIISLKSPESSHLKRTIQDFTDGVIDIDDDEDGAETPEAGKEIEMSGDSKGDEGVEIEVDGNGVNVEKKDKKDEEDKDGEDGKDGKKED